MKLCILVGLLLLMEVTQPGTASDLNDTATPRVPRRKQNIQLNLNFNLGLFDCNSTDCCANKTCNGTKIPAIPGQQGHTLGQHGAPPDRHHARTPPGVTREITPPWLIIEVVPRSDPWAWKPAEPKPPTGRTTRKRDYPKIGEYIEVSVCDYDYDNGESCKYFCGLLGYVQFKCEDFETCHCWEKKQPTSTTRRNKATGARISRTPC